MYLEKLEIRGFGKFNNLTINLSKGMNIIYGCNESGKTTIQLFIKGIFFGLKGGRPARDGEPPALKKYRPWSMNDYNGSIEYTLDNGMRYKAGRNFINNTVRVFDSFFNDVTGTFKISREKGVLFAEEHLGVNEACFDKTLFIKQMESRIDDGGSGELLNKLTNASQTGFEDVSFKKAHEALREALKNYVGTDKTSTRPLDKVVSRLQELKSLKVLLLEKRNRLFNIGNDLNNALIKRSSLESIKPVLAKTREFIDARKKIDRYKKQRDELREILGYIVKNEAELSTTLNSIDEFKNIKGLNMTARYVRTGERHIRNSAVMSLVLSAVFFAAGMIDFSNGAVESFSYAAALISMAAALILVFIMIKSRTSKKNIISEIDKKQKILEDIYYEAVKRADVLNDDLQRLYRKASLIRGTNCDNKECLSGAVNELNESINSLDEAVREFAGHIEGLCAGKGFNIFEACDIDEEILMCDINKLESIWESSNSKTGNELYDINLKIREYETLIGSLMDDDDSVQKNEEEIEELELGKNKLEEIGFSLKTALDVLLEASVEIQRDFAPVLNNTMSRIIKRISGGRYKELKADDNLNLKTIAPETGDVVPVQILSAGTVDQVYLALRFALADMITEKGEKLPFIMDEVFARYDDARTVEAFRFLSELSEEKQLVLFTCKGREGDIAREVCGEKVNIIRLNDITVIYL